MKKKSSGPQGICGTHPVRLTLGAAVGNISIEGAIVNGIIVGAGEGTGGGVGHKPQVAIGRRPCTSSMMTQVSTRSPSGSRHMKTRSLPAGSSPQGMIGSQPDSGSIDGLVEGAIVDGVVEGTSVIGQKPHTFISLLSNKSSTLSRGTHEVNSPSGVKRHIRIVPPVHVITG